MKKEAIFLPTIFGLVLCGIVLNFAFGSGDIHAQVSRISRTAKSAPTGPSAESAPTAGRFAFAASQNAGLRHNLRWNFGGRTQIGWNIYVPLASHTIGTDASPDSAEFALALARWQAGNGLGANGILDESTLWTMTRFWQAQRLGRSNIPAADRLLPAPNNDFFDPTRSPELLMLERDTYGAYKKMIAAAAKDLGGSVRFTESGELAPGEKFLRIVSAYRSPEYQAALRRKQPGAGRAALAKNSPHFTGQALDIYVGGEPVSTKDANRLIQVQTPAYKWLVKNAHKFGFYPYFYEPWHWEYVGHSGTPAR